MTGEDLPRARVRRRRVFQLVWIVPLIAIGLAAWIVYRHVSALGPEITIRFSDGNGLRPGQTPVLYRGVQIGEVSGMSLSEDNKQVLVRARMRRAAESIAREGAQFWIVRPQLGWGNVTGLNTVLSGPEIHALPGEGDARKEFDGRDSAPMDRSVEGLRIVLKAERPKSVRVNTPVYYRGVEVGAVQRLDLAPNSAAADIHVLIYKRYTSLVRDGSAFWNSGGASLTANLREGLNLEIESLRNFIGGGIEFATPHEKAPRAKQGAVYFLYDKPRPEWLGWSPKLSVPNDK